VPRPIAATDTSLPNLRVSLNVEEYAPEAAGGSGGTYECDECQVRTSSRQNLKTKAFARTMKWMKAEKKRTDGSYSRSGATTSPSVDGG
jgi:hypothetical protein